MRPPLPPSRTTRMRRPGPVPVLVAALTVGLLAAGACTTPQSSRSEAEASVGPLSFDAATEQVEGSVAFGDAADGPWQRRSGSLTVQLDPAPRLARLDVLGAEATEGGSVVFDDGEASIDLGAVCGEQSCADPVAYRITTDATDPTTLTGTATAAFESDDTADLGAIELDVAEVAAVPIDLDLPLHSEARIDLELAIDSTTPVAGAFVTLSPAACGEPIEVAAIATPPDSVPADNGTAQVVAADGTAHGLAHEGVTEVTLNCGDGTGAAERSLWLTLAGGTEVGRTVRLVLLGEATDGAEVVPATAREGDEVALELAPADDQDSADLEAPDAAPGAVSTLTFAQLDGFDSYDADLSAGPFDDGDTAGTVRLLVGPCPPADCTEAVPASLQWFGAPPEDATTVSASFTTWALDAAIS